MKTGGHVLLWIPPEVKQALDALPLPMQYEDNQPVDRGFFFWTGNGDKRRTGEIAGRLLKSVFRKEGLTGAHPHRFRHALATDILARGGTMADVADVLGISETIARKHYAKWSVERQQRVNRVLRSVYLRTPAVHGEKGAVIN
jgi:integrase